MMTSMYTLILALVLMTSLCTVHTQWAQTLGWGGAGMGKRTSLPASNFMRLLRYRTTPRDAITASSLTRENSASEYPLCPANPDVLKIVNDIIEEEELRIQQCLAAVTIQGKSDISQLLQDRRQHSCGDSAC